MTMYPDVFRKAQAEIDRVIGPDRLPDFDDRESLPYLECIIREVYRSVFTSDYSLRLRSDPLSFVLTLDGILQRH